MLALFEFDEYLYGEKAEEKKDVLQVSLLAKMQCYRPSGVKFFFYIRRNIHSILFYSFQTIFELNPHQKSAQCEVMKNKRKAHKKIIENFQEKSQQAESLRHDLIDTHEVS